MRGTTRASTLQQTTLTRTSVTTVRLDARSRVGDAYPQDPKGVCWSDASDVSTTSPCTRRNVITGTLVAPIAP